jgi:hypothetical protein
VILINVGMGHFDEGGLNNPYYCVVLGDLRRLCSSASDHLKSPRTIQQ